MDQAASSSTSEQCPNQVANASPWAHLPHVVLQEVFRMLNNNDRRNASLVCKNWRQHFFQPRWFSSVDISIQTDELDKARFLINTFGSMVTNSVIILHALSPELVKEFTNLLEQLWLNRNLDTLTVALPRSFQEMSADENRASDEDLEKMMTLLRKVTNRICDREGGERKLKFIFH